MSPLLTRGLSGVLWVRESDRQTSSPCRSRGGSPLAFLLRAAFCIDPCAAHPGSSGTSATKALFFAPVNDQACLFIRHRPATPLYPYGYRMATETPRTPRKQHQETGRGARCYIAVMRPMPQACRMRVNPRMHALLRALAKEGDEPMQAILDKAVERYRRETFLRAANADYAALRRNTKAWKATLRERAIWDITLPRD